MQSHALAPAIGAAKATFRSLHDAWADTTTPHGRLILTVLAGLAEFERHLVARTSEGRKCARARGVLFGRPRKLTPGVNVSLAAAGPVILAAWYTIWTAAFAFANRKASGSASAESIRFLSRWAHAQ